MSEVNTELIKKRRRQSRGLFILAMLVCTIPPALATLSYFPLWREATGGARTALGTLLLLSLAVLLPLWRFIAPRLRQPAPMIMWAILFTVFYLIKDIVANLTVIAFWGMVSSALATALFALSAYLKPSKVQNKP